MSNPNNFHNKLKGLIECQVCTNHGLCVCRAGWQGRDCQEEVPAWMSTYPPQPMDITLPPPEDPGPTETQTHVCKSIIFQNCVKSSVCLCEGFDGKTR